jgi:hypothetical protein
LQDKEAGQTLENPFTESLGKDGNSAFEMGKGMASRG